MTAKTAHRLLYKLTCMDLAEYPLTEADLESEVAQAYGEEIDGETWLDKAGGLIKLALQRGGPIWTNPDYEIPEQWIRESEMPKRQ